MHRGRGVRFAKKFQSVPPLRKENLPRSYHRKPFRTVKRSTIMIGFSIDIDLTTVFPRLSRAPCPPTLPTPLEERLPLRLQDGRRVSIASGGPYRLRVGVYLNLKLEDRSGAIDYTPPFPSRSFSSNSWLLSIVSKPATSLEKLINSCLSLSLSL